MSEPREATVAGAGVDRGAADAFDELTRAMGADGGGDPYPELAALRAAAPVHPGLPHLGFRGRDLDIPTFTAYAFDAVQAVLGDGHTYSSAAYGDTMGIVMGRSILEMDEPEHRAYRSILQQAFTRGAMERWEAEVVWPLVDRMVGDLSAGGAGRADLVRELLFPFPVRVIAALLGIPEADVPEFHRLATELISLTVDWDRAVAASATLRDYFAGILAERRRRPADRAEPAGDMVSVLATAEHDGQRLTDDEIFAFCRLLLPAGAETTYRSSSNLVFGLLSHGEQLDALRADRGLMGAAIEEGIRWEPPLLFISRTTTRSADLCGVAIPAGAAVVCHLGAANHDGSRWPDPDAFDIRRERRPHIGFAHGAHVCLGMHLARMETRVVLDALLDRLPALRFDPDAPPPRISGRVFRAPPRLDVAWGDGG